MPTSVGPDDHVSVDEAIAGVIVEIDAVAAGLDDAVVADDVSLPRGVARPGRRPSS